MNTGTDSSDSTMSEINVTPMVDVMLVLLIIFMVTAPLMQQGVEVDLPQTHAQVIKNEKDQPIILSIDKDKKIYIGKTQVPRDNLEAKLIHNEKLKKDKKIDLQADRSLDYGFVVDILAVLRRAGIDQVGMLTEPPPPDGE
ncbi:MAG: protein TolR [Deltaproteobacteria bacterium]|nr:protein TolR [Deltaproteobacteria bacterium]MBW1870467.1 protein TolR [Deltaproteobacteria bacterium]